jgi:hypothetical protein
MLSFSMKDFYLTTAFAVVIITSLASNLLWVMAFGPPAPGSRARLRSALGELATGLRHLAGAGGAVLMARRERQGTDSRLDDLNDREIRDIGLYRNHFGLVSSERERHVGASGFRPHLDAASGWPR